MTTSRAELDDKTHEGLLAGEHRDAEAASREVLLALGFTDEEIRTLLPTHGLGENNHGSHADH
jgi:hypothetical protein